MKQVFDRTQHFSGLHRDGVPRLRCRGKISPFSGDHGLASIGQDQDKVQLALAMDCSENLKRFGFEWVVAASNRDPLGMVLMMGSVWCLSSMKLTGNF
jgi:hypothetical protein